MSIKLDGVEASKHVIKRACTGYEPNTEKDKKRLAIITVGEDEASKIYVARKKKVLTENNILYHHLSLPESTSMFTLECHIEALNYDRMIDGIIVQQPLPPHLSIHQNKINNLIRGSKDIDGLGNNSPFIPCTPLGIIRLIEHYKINVCNKRVVIAGRSKLVAKPLSRIFMDEFDCTVTMIHSKTPKDYVKTLLGECDIFVSAIGCPKWWRKEHFELAKEQKLALIDVGINRRENGEVFGDCDPEIYDLFQYYTPVPKGVGQMTVASLVENILNT